MMSRLAASYAAEYWTDSGASTESGTVGVGGPHVIEFASISALADWVQFNALQANGGRADPLRLLPRETGGRLQPERGGASGDPGTDGAGVDLLGGAFAG